MEEKEAESLDGSSIKPVSSLRSHFEQMAKPTNKSITAPPRPISPKPKMYGPDTITSTNPSTAADFHIGTQPSISNSSTSHARPLGLARQTPELSSNLIPARSISPSVMVDPPSSPPRTLNLNLALAGPSTLLTADGSRTSSNSGASSPRHFRIPSTPSTPSLEPKKISKAVNVPPEPPPPRRSGEYRREGTIKTLSGLPPPVNRAEKPKAFGNLDLLGHSSECLNLPPAKSQPVREQASPFSTPPSSDSSPGSESLRLVSAGPASVGTQPHPRSRTPVMAFDPPPIHHSLLSSRKDQDSNGQARTNTASQLAIDFGEQRPALPARPSISTSSSSSARNSMDFNRPYKGSNASVDTLISSKNGTIAIRVPESDPSLPMLPKRNFSTPTSQLQTPPRTHGRSMTLDQTSDRTPTELRAAGNVPPAKKEKKELNVTTKLTGTMPVFAPYSSDEYPDNSFSNRRPPHFKHGPAEIFTKYDTRIFDVFGEYICTSGYHTRVWSLRDGEQVMNISHGETTKMLAISFKPAAEPDNEGSRLWLGSSLGELMEIKVLGDNPVVASNGTAHGRREVIKIYRHADQMWTLDESGTLNVWASDRAQAPELDKPSATYRVPKGHSFSMVVKHDLWYATGTDIRVFAPTVDGRTPFKLVQEPLAHHGTGEVTSGAVINGQPEKVYFGDSNGKVSIYSSQNYTCLGTVTVSAYKINSLTGAGVYLWAAYNTGMMYIYDTTQVPWVVKKDWRAHVNPVVNIVTDRSSFWNMGRLQIISLGADNSLQIWDGLLREDWLEEELQAQDHRFCDLEQIKALVMTWNAGASTPHSLRYAEEDRSFIPSLLKESGLPDILVFGFQELVDLEDKKTTAKSFFSKSKRKDPSEQEHMSHQYRDWRDYIIRCLDDSMPQDEFYHLLQSTNLVGLFTCVFVRARLRDRIRGVSVAEVKRGMGGRAGNKGALILRFMVDDTSLCFINCHLAAGQNQTKDRNFDISSILDSTILPVEEHDSVRLDSYIGGGDGTMILDHEICILSGDLNYRIDTMNRDAVINALKSGRLERLLERDQLLASKRKRPGFRLRAFHEMPITFAPTYKYDVGTDTYDTSEKKRAPAWCDRILFRGRDRKRLEQLEYRRHEVRVSDHRPVTGLFRMTVKKISPEKRAVVWEECKRRFDEVSHRIGASAKLDFLVSICGLDNESSQKLLLRHVEIYR